jgi:Tol biopolymer transport system component
MPLADGTRLEHYEIVEPLGAGGMGEVYRAVDTKLRREVAIKILPPKFANDPSRLARFEREAHLLASLNHPNIAAIYGLEHIDGIRFLVLELVEGPTLSERLKPGPMEVGEALGIAAQIAEALEAAHEKGVVHRDLKPGNVKITPAGKVKVLDFGLAKALGDPEPASTSSDPQAQSTVTLQETKAGVVLGTAAYMSPEQAEGKPTDKRSDVWSFGVVLYEMLSGKRCFEGKTTSHLMLHVLEQEPDWEKLPAAVPDGVRQLLGRCLEKDAAKRLRDVGDAGRMLEAFGKAAKPASAVSAVVPPAHRALRFGYMAAGAGAVAVLALGFVYLRPRPAAPPAPPVRFEIVQPENVNFTSVLSVSPDGRKLAFIATGADGRTLLWVRSLETLEARPLDGTDGINGVPFWSPDSRNLVFSAGGKLKRIEATGSPAQTLCDVSGIVVSGFWTPDGKIVFGATGASDLLQVTSAGGRPSPVIASDPNHPTRHLSPSLLPDGRHFVYARGGSSAEETGIFLGSLDAKPASPDSKKLLPDTSQVAFAPSADPGLGYLLFVRRNTGTSIGTLMAQPLDTKRLELAGEAVPVAEQVPNIGFSVSATGVLVYRAGPASSSESSQLRTQGQLTWFDRAGKVLGTAGDPGQYEQGIRLSPDETRVAVARRDAQSSNIDIWVFELARGANNRFTFDPAPDLSAIWSPDGSKIAFFSARPAAPGIYQKSSNGAGSEELLFKSAEPLYPASWSSDGRFLVYSTLVPFSVGVIPLAGDPAGRKAVTLVKSEFMERGARFSPDDRYLSYTSNETGKDEAYVRPFDAASVSANGGKWMISTNGGQSPHWRGDGKEMFYKALDGTMMSVSVTTSPVFHADAPKPLFKGPATGFVYWDNTADGKRFLVPVPGGAASSAPYKVVLNWTSTLKK